jgi:hypothetical protein
MKKLITHLKRIPPNEARMLVIIAIIAAVIWMVALLIP